MTRSASETVIATVSEIDVQGSTITYVSDDSPPNVPFNVGGNDHRTTPDVWDIRVFDYNTPFDTLTSHYIIRVLLGPNTCGVRVWKTPVDLSLT
jgi:hypothetical protein